MAGGRSKHGYIDWGEIEEKILLLKTYSSAGRVVIFDTRPHDFIVVSDDLTTANMDP